MNDFDNEYLDNFMDKIRNGGITQSANYGATHSERAQIELAVVNYESSKQLLIATEQLNKQISRFEANVNTFNKSSAKSSRWMMILSIMMACLTIVQVALGYLSLQN